jgi:cytochrome c peroxidase
VKRVALLLLALTACPSKGGEKTKPQAGSGSAPPPAPADAALVIAPLPDLPFGLPARPANPRITPAAVARGAQLFEDTGLSAKGDRACATCHDPNHGYAGKTYVAADGKRNMRRTPALVNLAWAKAFGWDGRYGSIGDLLMAHIKGQLGGTDTSPETLQALEAFVLTRYEGDSPWDREERTALAKSGNTSDPVVAGYQLFMGKAKCGTCHPPPLYTDGEYHVVVDNPYNDPARAAVDPSKRNAFKTPTLRGAASRISFFHDGSAATLADVVAHYRTAAERFPELEGVRITEAEAAQLVAFVEALTAPTR